VAAGSREAANSFRLGAERNAHGEFIGRSAEGEGAVWDGSGVRVVGEFRSELLS
jgi:hypothetical protein